MARRIEVAVIGAGPAGISAAIFLKRAGVAPVLFENHEVGGLLRNANLVENYPGFPEGIGGKELSALFAKQLEKHSIAIRKSKVSGIGILNSGFRMVTDSGIYFAKVVILCTGTMPKKTVLEGCSDLIGKRIFYEVASLPPLRGRKKRILIIGGGDAAFDYSIGLRERGHDVTIISRSKPTCLALLRKRAERSGIRLLERSTPVRVREEPDGLLLTLKGGSRGKELRGDYLLIACGRRPNNVLIRYDRDLDTSAMNRTARAMKDRTSRPPATVIPGLFMAGDVIRGIHRQTGIAVGDGMLAAMLAIEFLRGGEVEE